MDAADEKEAIEERRTVRCPICNLKMTDGTCENHGTLCETCGTLFKDRFCPNCYSSQLTENEFYKGSRSTGLDPGILRLGELGIGSKELGAITGRDHITRRESNILSAATGEDSNRRKIRQKAESAIRWLSLPRNLETELLENVERGAMSFSKRYRTEARSCRVHISLEKLVGYSFLIEAKKIGKTILEAQEALAKAGFNIKLERYLLRIVPTCNNDIAQVKMNVNGWKKSDFNPKTAGEGPLGKEYSVAVQLLLSDTIDQQGKVGERELVKVGFENAIVLSCEAMDPSSYQRRSRGILLHETKKLGKKQEKSKFLQKAPNEVLLKVDAGKCFSLFKTTNRMLLLFDAYTKEDLLAQKRNLASGPSPETEASIRQHLPLPSKKLPASAMLMQRASCLARVERRSVELFRKFLENSQGRSQRTLAHDALIQSDKEIYSTLPQTVKLAMRAYVSTLPLKRSDKRYTGVVGLVIPSEIDQVRSGR